MTKKILILEDEQDLAELLTDYLQPEGYSIHTCGDGESGLKKALSEHWDLVLLDVMLPKLDGFGVLRQLRSQRDVPVLLLTALNTDGDKIRGFGLGADDYITKPFSPAELTARIKAHLNRYIRLKGDSTVEHWLSDGGLEFNRDAKRVKVIGVDVNLTVKEFELLDLFIHNPDRVFSKEELFDRIWGSSHYGDTSTVTVHIRRLREKIELDPANPKKITTVWGMGYRWQPGGV